MLKRWVGKKEMVVVEAVPQSNVDGLVEAWLRAKARRSGSSKTEQTYRVVIEHFRKQLQAIYLDLDSDEASIALAAEGFAGTAWPSEKHPHQAPLVGPKAFNQRLAILSSFYTYALRQPQGLKSNPILRIERAKVQAYGSARALNQTQVRQDLLKIPRDDQAGMRDYALLSIALTTGRRVGELASLRWGDIELGRDGSVVLRFKRAKGGKQVADLLAGPVAQALLGYLRTCYRSLEELEPAKPIWISLSNHDYGEALTVHSMERICRQRLGTSIFHRTRHTFAHQMKKAGAQAEDIQHRLGHASLQTTGIYLAEIERDENPFAEQLADLYGIGK